MKLVSVHVTNFKSIEDSTEVPIDPKVTVLVGQNESGKTAFLQSMYKARDVEGERKFSYIEDYPRRLLNSYEPNHETHPGKVISLKYGLDIDDISGVNQSMGFKILSELDFTLNYNYKNYVSVNIDINEGPFVGHLASKARFTSDTRGKIEGAKRLSEMVDFLEGIDLNSEEEEFLTDIKDKYLVNIRWEGRAVEQYIYDNYIGPKTPKFLYFDDYFILPGQVNLPDLRRRMADRSLMRDIDRTAESLLRLAGVTIDALTEERGYETIRAKLEGISNSITDKVFSFWKQNSDLEVQFDVHDDPNDDHPFNSGDNLYIRIRNLRHRVTVPFSQRSKGFIWFFSFLTWFDSVQKQYGTTTPLILLLDEPGLSLHGLAQADFLRYIDELSKNHQIIYTTHSPFLIHSERLYQTRTVQDKDGVGTKISNQVSSSDQDTLFPCKLHLGIVSLRTSLFRSATCWSRGRLI